MARKLTAANIAAIVAQNERLQEPLEEAQDTIANLTSGMSTDDTIAFYRRLAEDCTETAALIEENSRPKRKARHGS